MAAVQWGYSFGYRDPVADEARLAAVEAVANAANTAATSAWYATCRGSVTPIVVAQGAQVRVPIPALFQQLPTDSRWTRSPAGVLSYDGILDGLFVANVVFNFTTSVGVLQTYTVTIAEGTGLETGTPTIRDSESMSLPLQLAGGAGTLVIAAPLVLRASGGQVALFVQHTALASVTITPSSVSVFIFRIDPEPES